MVRGAGYRSRRNLRQLFRIGRRFDPESSSRGQSTLRKDSTYALANVSAPDDRRAGGGGRGDGDSCRTRRAHRISPADTDSALAVRTAIDRATSLQPINLF